MPQLTCNIEVTPEEILEYLINMYKEYTHLADLLEKRFPDETHVYVPKTIALLKKVINTVKVRLGKLKSNINLNYLKSDMDEIYASIMELEPFSIHKEVKEIKNYLILDLGSYRAILEHITDISELINIPLLR
jgi:hypothetical protein